MTQQHDPTILPRDNMPGRTPHSVQVDYGGFYSSGTFSNKGVSLRVGSNGLVTNMTNQEVKDLIVILEYYRQKVFDEKA